MSRLTRDGMVEPSRDTKFPGANEDREIFIFLVQLTTSRVGSLTRLIHTLLYMMSIHTYTVHIRANFSGFEPGIFLP